VHVVVSGLRFRYPRSERWLIEDATFDIAIGETVAVVGPSGSGKTTLLALVGGMLTPQAGSITLASSTRASASVAWIFQSPSLLPRRTALDNVALPLLAAGESREAASTQAGQLLESVGLGYIGHLEARRLSGGEAQRVAAARALAAGPDLLIADEPTASLDRNSAAVVGRAIISASVDRSLLIATHDAELAALADKQYALSVSGVLRRIA
jgi:ABC-type lipoprotein export system ATPase subunit